MKAKLHLPLKCTLCFLDRKERIVFHDLSPYTNKTHKVEGRYLKVDNFRYPINEIPKQWITVLDDNFKKAMEEKYGGLWDGRTYTPNDMEWAFSQR